MKKKMKEEVQWGQDTKQNERALHTKERDQSNWKNKTKRERDGIQMHHHACSSRLHPDFVFASSPLQSEWNYKLLTAAIKNFPRTWASFEPSSAPALASAPFSLLNTCIVYTCWWCLHGRVAPSADEGSHDITSIFQTNTACQPRNHKAYTESMHDQCHTSTKQIRENE